jgi:S-disulfanyl-L-cysteine oxidoreductase SoxD
VKRAVPFLCVIVFGVAAARAGQAPKTRTIWEGIYTEAQAIRGQKAYKVACGYCHKDNLAGGFFDDGNGRAPALTGPRAFDSSFEKRWAGKTVGEMVIEIGTAMPQNDPGSLAPETYVDIITFLLAQNGVPPGTAELPPELDALQGIRMTPKP